MKTRINRRTLVAATMLSACGWLMSPAQAQEVVKIGVLLSLSGPTAAIGIPERDIVEIMARKINAEGGINGRKLELIYQDDKSNPTEAARAATKLIHEDKVQALIGPTGGSSTLAVMPIAARNNVPALVPIGTISATSREHSFFPWVFRTCPTSTVAIEAMINKVVFKPGIKRVAIMTQEDAYGRDETALAQRLIKERGGIEIVEVATTALTATDLTPAATRIRNSNPDIVLLLTSAPALGGAFVRAAELANLKAPIIGGISLAQQPFVDAAGKAGEGVMSTTLGNWNEPSEKQKKLGELIKQAGKEPAGYAELIGSATIITLAEALKKIDGPVTGTKIRDTLETICNFDGTFIDGKLCFSRDSHDGYGPETIQVVKIQNGKWVNVK